MSGGGAPRRTFAASRLALKASRGTRVGRGAGLSASAATLWERCRWNRWSPPLVRSRAPHTCCSPLRPITGPDSGERVE